jgi:hypothetical protein
MVTVDLKSTSFKNNALGGFQNNGHPGHLVTPAWSGCPLRSLEMAKLGCGS